MINGYSIRKCAKIVEISIPTSFYWRHKILDAIRTYMGVGSVGGVVEVDEAFFRESFKGNHKKSTTFTMPRKAHKSYIKFAQNLGIELQQIKRGKYKEGIYHRILDLERQFIYSYTKYLNICSYVVYN